MTYVRQVRDLKLYPLKVGVITSSNYQKLSDIRTFFGRLNQLPNYIIINAGGGGYAADDLVKELSLELDFKYVEYNPFHTPYNQYSAMPKYRYGKTFSTGNLAIRYTNLIKGSDKLVIFQDREGTDVFVSNVCKQIEKNKFSIPTVIIQN